eukprot:jgi/Tetstr1/454012/TSEL_040931.t1
MPGAYERLAGALPAGLSIKTVFEVGSRDCLDAIGLHKRFGCKVFAFECNPEAVQICRANLKDCGYTAAEVELVEKAVFDREGPLEFHPVVESRKTVGGHPDFVRTADGKLANIGASSLFKMSEGFQLSKYRRVNHIQGPPVSVDAVRLDAFMDRSGIDAVDLLCMDVQGAELYCLQGLGEKLDSVQAIITELCTSAKRGGKVVEAYEGQGKIDDVFRLLEGRGFRCINGNKNRFAQDDFVFVKDSRQSRDQRTAENGPR